MADEISGQHMLTVLAPPGSLFGELLASLLRQLHPGVTVRTTTSPDDRPYLRVTRDAAGASDLLVFLVAPSQAELTELAVAGSYSAVMVSSSAIEFEVGVDALLGNRGAFVSRSVRTQLASGRPDLTNASSDALSPREAEVLSQVEAGLSNHEIGLRLRMSPHTVRAHLQSASLKLGVSGRLRLVAYAREQKLLPWVGGRSRSA